MKFLSVPLLLIMGLLSGCAPANISSVMRESDGNNQYMQTRCAVADMRDKAEMDRVFTQYDGWRMIYLSEYTTGNRFGTVGAVCFERPQK
jgi:hypothetical protein